MRFTSILVAALAVFAGATTVASEEYLPSLDGMQVLDIAIDSPETMKIIKALDNRKGFEVWKMTRALVGGNIKVTVAPDQLPSFKQFLEHSNISYAVYIENVKEKVDEEARQLSNVTRTVDGRISFTAYQQYDAIVAYLQQLASQYSNIVSLINLGTSYEGRIIYAIKISSGGTGKPAILLEGGLHAREWISPATVTYIINQLVENSANSALYRSVDWYIVPVLNPDGYEFTFSRYRLWRKTRSINRGSSCVGVDGNRNFGYHWMGTGASDNPCSEIFAGTVPFSESETSALRDFVLANRNSIKLYITFHSYGDYILYPWGYTSDLPSNADTLHSLAVEANAALSSLYGTNYTIGSSTNVLYAAAGGSDDWVMGGGGVELCYTVELPGGGWFGFDLPASRIIPVGQETFEAIKVFGNYVATTYA